MSWINDFVDAVRGGRPDEVIMVEAKSVTDARSVSDADRLINSDFPDLQVSSYIDYGAFSKFRELADNRRTQYQGYENMLADTIISSAIEMYADDACQSDIDGRVVWAECDKNDDLQSWINDLLDTLRVPEDIWSYAYSIALYGDLYLRLYKKPKSGSQKAKETKGGLIKEDGFQDTQDFDYEDYVEILDNPEDIFDLMKEGKTAQFAYINRDFGVSKRERTEMHPANEFVHFLIKRPDNRDKQLFEFKTRDEETGKMNRHVYKVSRGKSMVHDVYGVEQEIQLLENSILMNRLSRSAVTRMVSVEVGDMAKPEVAKLLRRTKSALENKLSINKNEGMGNYNSPSQVDNVVVHPMRNGKGAIQASNIGGDVDVKSLLDLDYFNDKRFGGLKIPKPFLGFEESLGANAGGTLTKMDARYGRTIKRLQGTVIAGITTLVNLYLIARGKADDVNNFTIMMTSPTTVEDLDRDELVLNRLNIASQVLSMVGSIESVDQQAVATHIVEKYLKDEELVTILGGGTPKPKEDTKL